MNSEIGGDKTEEVSVERLDTVVSRTPAIRGPFMLKIDVQGAELDVLEGATGILSQTCVVTCEVNTKEFYEGQARIDSLFHFLHQNQFRLVDIEDPVRDPQNDEVLYTDLAFAQMSTSNL